jgi:class 3 adenylate cyclase
VRYFAGLIPGAKFVELPGIDHMEAVGETEALLSELELFITGKVSDRLHDRILATVLFTDIVDSTKLATMCGDHRWKEIRSEHDAEAVAAIQEYRGKFVKSTGDGILATFDGPARAIRCAKSIGERVQGLNLQIRAGLHTGEIDLIGEDISGIAVNLAARIMALAPNGSVAVSRTVKDLVAGSNLSFSDLGTHELKGVPGEWQIYQVV